MRFRIALDGKDRFRWKKGDKPLLYGLGRLADARAASSICLVEGESDTHTLWHAGFPAIGVPGGGAWREDRDAEFFDGIAKIHVVIEPDQGGKTVLAWLGKSRIRERAYLVRPSGFKDPSALYLDDPGVFAERWQGALDASPSWAEEAARAATAARAAASIACKGLLELPDILSAVVETLRSSGFVGEERAIKLIYLAVTSRLFSRIVSVAVKGASSGGKSYLVERVLSLFPEDAAYVLSALSERALAYSKEPLSHRMLVLVEAAGLAGKFATYLLRSLLSEGRIRYETVEKTKDGLRPKMIERAGPTGLIITTTAPRLHSENETRLISVTVSDTPEQTAAILKAQALRRQKESLADRDDLARWHALQVLLASGPAKVTIPFADALAELIPLWRFDCGEISQRYSH